jgi:hypothetical protein
VREPGAPLRVLLVEDSEKVAWAHELQQRNPPDADAPRGLPEVLRSGRSEFYPEVPDEMLVAAARDPEHLRLMRWMRYPSRACSGRFVRAGEDRLLATKARRRHNSLVQTG